MRRDSRKLADANDTLIAPLKFKGDTNHKRVLYGGDGITHIVIFDAGSNFIE
jgi:hypothetical protein